MAPSREHRVSAGECTFPWSGRADLGAAAAIPVVLGHARSMQAIHGGKATHATSDSHKLAVLLRGGMRPQAAVYPAERRATRDLWRRRPPLMRQRADLWAPVPHPNHPNHWPAIGQTIADQANRAGVAARLADPAVHQNMAVDWALVTADDQRLTDRELSSIQAAHHHDAPPLSLLHTVPGRGTILNLVLRYGHP